MGNVLSSGPERGRDTECVTSESETMDANTVQDPEHDNAEEEFHDAAADDEARERARAKEEEMDEFRKQLLIKREQRKEILARHRSEKEKLEKALKNERTLRLEMCHKNEQFRQLLMDNNIEIPEDIRSPTETLELTDAIIEMREEFEKIRADNNKLRRDLVDANNSLQGAYSDIADLNAQNLESIKQIHALKEVVSVSKTLINLREGQLNELKDKLVEIERSLSEREANMLSVDLRQEYERQLQNIRTLRGLYEERARLAEVTRLGLVRDLEEQKLLYQAEVKKSRDLTEKVEALEDRVDALQEIIDNKNLDISTFRDETNGLKSEMAVVNKLFSQVLLGYKTKQDLDKLVHRLEENHGLLTHMAENENDAEASTALPKLLLELVSQVDEELEENSDANDPGNSANESPGLDTDIEDHTIPVSSTKAEEIVENLPKVWRVLMELLSHQSVVDNSTEKVTTCYKSVETKSGPVLVPSVSQTYIRLKDLIVEKLGLVKEVNRMKQLNGHLENRLQEQEKRLCLVTTELSKTWHVVGKLRRHHYQLHTHEKILKYELQQKRKLLNELKEELEYCREKWEQAREKNTQSEKDWRKLRAEFTSRKTKPGSPSFNQSGESGYSDERPSDESSESYDESEYVDEPLQRSKKKVKRLSENVLDSSADFNLTAEREDPVSDMLDVAELSFDTQDGQDNIDQSLGSSNSERLLRRERTYETEDEIPDIAHDDIPIEDSSCNGSDNENQANNSSTKTATFRYENNYIDSETIANNIKQQNERLAKKDKRVQNLEKSSAALLIKTQKTQITEQLNDNSDHFINRPGCSFEKRDTSEISKSESSMEIDLHESDQRSDQTTPHCKDSTNQDNTHTTAQTNVTIPVENDKPPTNDNFDILTDTPIVDFKAILESVKQQDERLAAKDSRLQKLETSCSEVVNDIEKTLNSGVEICEKLDTLHNKHGNTSEADQLDDVSEPSTSSNNHEARFAARDLRLKRLEEQTKNLVKKVNKTTSKGVKINYKLEELHNIYGSENSRAGTPTPSEDTEDKSIDEDNDQSQ